MLTLGLVSIAYRKLTPAEIIPLVRDAGLTASSYGSYYRPGAGQDFAPLPGRPSPSPDRE